MSLNTTVGVIPPPPGVTPNFNNPPSLAHITTTVSITFAVISSVFVVLRCYTTLFVLHSHKAADYLLVVAWLLALVYSVFVCIMPQFGFGRHLWDIPFAIFNINFFKIGAIMGVFYGMSIMLTKLSILTSYQTFITKGSRLQITVYAIMVVVIIYSILTSFEWIYACQPLEKFWDLTITEGKCVNFLKVTVFSGVMNVVTDAIILLLPLVILKDLHLPCRQKIAVMGIMMTGGFVLGISIVRAKRNVDSLRFKDITWQGAPMITLWVAEMYIAIICACLISLKPFLRKHFPRLLGSSYAATT